CEVADLHALPFADASFDQVLLFNVLTYVKSPARAIGEAARVLRPGGSLSLVTLAEHDHLDITAAFGHVHAGFAPAALARLLQKSGLEVADCDSALRERRPPYFQVVVALAHKRE